MGRRRRLTFAVAFVLLLLTASTALAATTRAKPNGKLTPRLAALANSAGLPLTHAAQARALSLPAKGAGSLLRRGDRILVDVRVASTSPASARKLAAAGARIVHVSRRYLTVTAAVAPQRLRSLAAVAGVENVQEVLAPMISGARSTDGGATATATCPSGAVRTEGDVQLKAGAARKKYGVSGTGIKVGVLSDSYDENAGAATHAAQDVANGDLPGTGNPCGHTTPVHVIADETSGTGEDEGRAMLQVVHDLAPASPLAYATAFDGLTSFASNIQALKTDGAKVIVDDISYFVEPFFQNGPIGVAVNQVAAGGVNYFSSAANSNVIVGGHNVASWEAPAFRTGACPAGLPSSFHCMDFNPTATVDGGYGVTLAPGGGFNLDPPVERAVVRSQDRHRRLRGQ